MLYRKDLKVGDIIKHKFNTNCYCVIWKDHLRVEFLMDAGTHKYGNFILAYLDPLDDWERVVYPDRTND